MDVKEVIEKVSMRIETGFSKYKCDKFIFYKEECKKIDINGHEEKYLPK